MTDSSGSRLARILWEYSTTDSSSQSDRPRIRPRQILGHFAYFGNRTAVPCLTESSRQPRSDLAGRKEPSHGITHSSTRNSQRGRRSCQWRSLPFVRVQINARTSQALSTGQS
jgi:hypothetical protein